MAFWLCRHNAQFCLLPHLKKPGGLVFLSPPLLKILGTWALKMRSLMFLVLVNVTRGGSGKYSLASTSLERRAECLLLRIAVIPGSLGSYGTQKTGRWLAFFWIFSKTWFLVSSFALSIAALTLAALYPLLTNSCCSLIRLCSRPSLVDSILTNLYAKL